MSSLFGIGGNAASSGFYEETIDQSLRFDDGNSKLVRQPSSDGDRKKWTTSFWVKRSQVGQLQYLWTSGSHSGNDGIAAIYFHSTDTIHTYFDTSGSNPYGAVNSRVYRDTSSWYHIVWAVDAVNTVQRIWVNGVEESLSSSLNPPNYAYGMNQSGINQTFGIAGWGGSPNLDGYLANIVHLDGQYLDETYFGETKNGIWVPKAISGLTFGTNGFHLTFADSSAIGDDISGNNNDFTPTGLTSDDVVIDSPTNNFCTFTAVGRRYGQSYVGSFSEGGLEIANGGNATHTWGSMAINNIVSEGGIYFEIRLNSIDASRTYFGLVGDSAYTNQNSSSNGASYSFPIKALVSNSGYGYFNTATDGSGSLNLTATTYTNGDIIGVAILSDGKFFISKNGTYINDTSGNTGNPSTGANPLATIDLTKDHWVPYVGYNSSFSINFGQDSSFGGRETRGSNQDANGIGNFKYAVPTNCLALCASNMAEPDIGPNSATQTDDHFNTVLWTATGSRHVITGVGFKPDWVWGKKRSNADAHAVVDVLRGPTKELATNSTAVEATNANGVESFDADGFTLVGSGSGSGVWNGNSGHTHVAWNWKAGGDPADVSGNFIRDGVAFTPSHGTITANKITVNTTAGFAITEFTSNVSGDVGESGSPTTVAHGLGKVPEWVIIKDRDGGSYPHWNVWHPGYQPDTTHLNYQFIGLQNTNAANNAGWTRADTGMTTNLFCTPRYQYTENGKSYIAYVFTGIEGYSKFGSYNANGATDGPMVYTGFRPAWVIIKRADGTSSWWMQDTKRSTSNVADEYLIADGTQAESTYTALDFISNGFKIRQASSSSFNSGDLIYAAFAEAPFKYANAR